MLGRLIIISGLFAFLLTGCNDEYSEQSQSTHTRDTLSETTYIPKATPTRGKLVVRNPLNPKQKIPIIGIPYKSGHNGTTSKKGIFQYRGASSITFTLFGQDIGPIPARSTIREVELARVLCRSSSRKSRCRYAAQKNLQRLLLSVDSNQDISNGIRIPATLNKAISGGLGQSIDQFELALGEFLNPRGRQAVRLFEPSLGINLEAVQPEADEVGGQPLPFVDLFRVSRPFPEYSCTDITYDEHGWPIEIPESCAQQEQPILRVPSYATTIMLRYVPKGAIPVGKYTVLYEGTGTLQYSGIASKIESESQPGRHIINITPELIDSRGAAGLRLMVKDIDPALPIKNIRIIMPGGICEGNPFIRASSSNDCPTGDYRDFADTLMADRNALLFNPDYLRFLKDFRVVRTMNLMEASPRNPCFLLTDDEYLACLTQEFTWDMRAKMDDASWGGSTWTPLIERYARGAPLEVAVALANQLGNDPWFNIPHNATDEYIDEYARYVRDHLNPELKAHIEYTNEPWNGIFWSALYVREKGKTLDDNPYRAGYKYYSTRAVEIFKRWEAIFGGTERLVRILNTYHPDEWMSRNMLSYNGNYQSVDVLASAPYFYGCWDRTTNSRCADESKIPMVISEAKTVKQLFSIIDNPEDPYGMAATLNWMKVQKQIADDFGVSFYSYEGGQHLTVHWGDSDLSRDRKDELLTLIRKANRNSRMGTRYKRFLTGWKKAGGELFTLYTLPQTYHRFGTFGIKEHLGQSRFQAPKYDKAMWFQEAQRGCWWEGC